MANTIRLPIHQSSNKVSDNHDDANKKSCSSLIHHLLSIENCKEFEPRPSAFIQLVKDRQIRRGLALTKQNDIVPSDNDIWIEQAYRTIHGKRVRYYCSMLTGAMVLFHPPTGAAFVIYGCDLEMYMSHPLIHEFVNQLPPVTIELVKTMRKAQPDVKFLNSIGFRDPTIKRSIWSKRNKANKSDSTQTATAASTIASQASM